MIKQLQASRLGLQSLHNRRNPVKAQQWSQIQQCASNRGHLAAKRLKCANPWPMPMCGIFQARRLHRDAKVKCSQEPGSVVVGHSPEQIFHPGKPGSWDDGGVGGAVVSCFIGDNEQRWFMWYSGRRCGEEPVYSVLPGAGSVGVATSTDGLNWERVEILDSDSLQGCTVEPNQDWWTFDTYYLVPSDVQILSSGSVGSGAGVYWMFYSGGAYGEVDAPPGLPGVSEGTSIKGLKSRPGLAMSQNGLNWARVEGPHYTGAIFDEEDDAVDWDSLFAACPQVVNAGPRDLRMYYHTFNVETQRYTTGLARSKDGFEWKKIGPLLSGGDESDFDCKGVAAQCVVRDVENEQFVMFYEGVDEDNVRSIGLAVSKDGLTEWKRCPHPILTKSSEGSWDGGSVGSPWSVSMAGTRWRLYYGGKEDINGKSEPIVSCGWKGIGLALSVADGQHFQGFPIEFKRRTSRPLTTK